MLDQPSEKYFILIIPPQFLNTSSILAYRYFSYIHLSMHIQPINMCSFVSKYDIHFTYKVLFFILGSM